MPQARELARGVMQECTAVGLALGIEPVVALERRLEAGIEVGDHKTSMLQDFENGKPLEIESLTGAVIEIASMLEIDVPLTGAIDAAVRLAVRHRDDADGVNQAAGLSGEISVR